MSTGIVIPYPHRTLQIGPYAWNSVIDANGDPRIERLTERATVLVEELCYQILKSHIHKGFSSVLVRLDAVPTDTPSWELQTLTNWREPQDVALWLSRKPRPGFEIEPVPGIVALLDYFRRLAADSIDEPLTRFGGALRSLPLTGLFRTLPRDTELYSRAADLLGVPAYGNWLEVPQQRGIYASARPRELPSLEWLKRNGIRLAGDARFGKLAMVPFFGGVVLKPQEAGEMAALWVGKNIPLIFQLLAGTFGGFYLKPIVGSSCDNSAYMRPAAGGSSWKDVKEVLLWSARENEPLWLMPWHEPRPSTFRGWGEIHRLYFVRNGNRFRLIGGIGTGTLSGFGHGSNQAGVWVVLPPETTKVHIYRAA